MPGKYKNLLLTYGSIILGDILLAIAIVVFYEPCSLVTGGVSGIAIVVENYTAKAGFAVPIWLTNLFLNIPLFFIAYKTMSRKFLIRTAFATMFLSAALYIVQFIPPIPEDILLSSLFGGVLSGLGLGLVFRAAATTGGSDLAAGILHHRLLAHYSIAKILFVVDSLIILVGLLAFGPVAAMYAVVSVFVISKVTDTMLEGLSFAKATFIISEHSEIIAENIITRMDRGVTSLCGRGMYTKLQKNILLCVVSAKEMPVLKGIVHELDEQAFVIVADVREVLGNGFGSGNKK